MDEELADAIEYLQVRERQVQAQIASLNAGLKKLHDALVALGVEPRLDRDHGLQRTDDESTTVSDEGESKTPDATPAPGANPGRYGRPVRAIVQAILEAENRWWTSAEVQEAVRAEVGPERVDKRLQATVRTALWTLRKHGQSTKDGEGRHLAARWRLTDTESPVAAGVSGTAPASGLGGEYHEAQNSHHQDLFRGSGDHHSSGAPVARG